LLIYVARGPTILIIAIPLFGTRISPDFDHAPSLLISDIESGRVAGSREINMNGWDTLQRVNHLKEAGVKTLICGGIANTTHSLLAGSGISIIPWVTGESKKALAVFMQGKLMAGTMLCPGRKKRWRFCEKQEEGRNKVMSDE